MVLAAEAKTGLRPLRRTDLLQDRLQCMSVERQGREEQVQAIEAALTTVQAEQAETGQQTDQQRALVAQLEADATEMFSDLILMKSFPAAIRRVREHRRLGHRTVLITGALDFVVEPLAPLFDDIVCAKLGVEHGRFNGELTDVPPTGESRAQALFDYADAHGLDLRESVAYADSTSDLPMLEVVGFPVAVNPETRLAALARKRGWLVEHFDKAPGAPKTLVPIGPRRRRHGGLSNPLVGGRPA